MADAPDAIAIDAIAESSAAHAAGKKSGATSLTGQNVKVLIALFAIFVLIVSDVFTNNVVSNFRGAVQGRSPTAYGTVVQGIFLVIFFALAVHLIEGGVI